MAANEVSPFFREPPSSPALAVDEAARKRGKGEGEGIPAREGGLERDD